MLKKDTFWAPLDNAAKIFPAIRDKEHTTVIRLTAVLKERITISGLLAAIKHAERRFPYFRVSLRKGFFWYYLEQVDHPVVVRPDDGAPCQAFGVDSRNRLLIRVLVFRDSVSVECSHILTDGYGAMTFLKAILLYYFREKGQIRDDEIEDVLREGTYEEEFEDAYNRFFKENIPVSVRQPKSFHILYPLRRRPRFDLLFAMLSISDLKRKAREKGVSITDYLVAVYLLVLQDVFFEERDQGFAVRNRIARVQVPVDLRKIYPTRTMRNFSLFVMPEIDFRLGRYSFDEILKIVYHRMQLETDEKLISKIISRNVGPEKNVFVRGIPLWVKSLVLRHKYYSEGADQYSGVVTNLGKIDLPASISDKVDHFAMSPPPPNKKLRINCGVIGYKDKLVLSFGNITTSREFERKYLHFLSGQGVHVKIMNQKTGK